MGSVCEIFKYSWKQRPDTVHHCLSHTSTCCTETSYMVLFLRTRPQFLPGQSDESTTQRLEGSFKEGLAPEDECSQVPAHLGVGGPMSTGRSPWLLLPPGHRQDRTAASSCSGKWSLLLWGHQGIDTALVGAAGQAVPCTHVPAALQYILTTSRLPVHAQHMSPDASSSIIKTKHCIALQQASANLGRGEWPTRSVNDMEMPGP